jgi:ATP-dependent RNA helicase SUPV3L1/SUV3
MADRVDGDIDTLSTRIAHIRTWTFVANRPDWLADPEHWQGIARGVEDKLSDALHERLAERFVDRRTSVLMRRLRENAALEPQINKTGDVVVEGHVIGRIDGFVFVADASSGGSEAKALQNAAQKALAGEIGARATRLADAADGQFVLAGDGTIRWTGAPVGKLIAGEEVLKPRLRVIADEQLTGAPREAVEARLERWMKSHLEKLLGPLFVLAAAEDVTGMARGVAFQLVEALGVLDRQRVAEEVKGLEQPARASLRKYGVRFGAYHIYLPALLKPAPRALAVQLWALRHEGSERKEIDDLLHLAGSGRTSIPLNRDIDAVLYRAAGYRVCGERAVRVDILERLADLIRPALAWREGTGGAKPLGAVAGGGFTVVNGMTSLTGASGEDFASILRSLGYRMERRPKPAAPALAEPTPAAPAPAPPEPAAQTDATPMETAATANDGATPIESVPLASSTTSDDEAKISDAADVSETTPDVGAPADHEAVLQPTAAQLVTASSASDLPPSPQSNVMAEASAEPAPSLPAEEAALIEVWRPGRAGRPEGRRRRHSKRRDAGEEAGRQPAHRQRQEEGAPVAAAADAAAAPPAVESAPAAAKPERPPRHRRHAGEHRSDRPQRDRERTYGKPSRFERREREKAPDPNSPFAKLAALKAQLEADAKERR